MGSHYGMGTGLEVLGVVATDVVLIVVDVVRLVALSRMA